ncbi:unnamed protein product [Blepharisma stoltei]|uniref:LNR domain-containing protein n=1 Tax=Blepharisma stoltei TaxID=1481888 RepID=A0AAU9J8I4_9CILI|nr:unnamed protein product [Blepharisma stoltei]
MGFVTKTAITLFVAMILEIVGIATLTVKFIIGFQDDLNLKCAEPCNTQNCYYGLGSCQECSPGCDSEMLGDGICDKSCNVALCNYDFGDCNNNQCNTDCEGWMIGDNNCNEECNNEACNWDGGDCDCSQGCLSYMKNNGICEKSCNNTACDYDGGDCGECAPGCLKDMLGDGVCDSACNMSDCHFDNYDCGCAEGCGIESYGQCKDSCMNSYCLYDTISETSQCQNQNLVLFSLHYAFISKNLTINVSPVNCTNTTNCLTSELLDSNSCHTNCKYAKCINSWNMCSSYTCADTNCLSCNSKTLGDCFKCNTNTYQFYGYCLTSCPGGHEPISLLGNYPVCLIPKDYSTKENPAVYYVTSKTSTDAYEGNGTFSNPFASLSLALASIYTKYSIIYLLNDGVHYLTCVNSSNPVSTLLSDVCYPLNRNYNLTSLLISSYDDSAILLKTKAGSKFQTFTVTNITTLTIKNIIFNGEDILSSCSSVNPYCSYCANITLKSDGYYYNDQGVKVSTFLSSSACNTYHNKILFDMYFGSKLSLENVNFTSWRMELKSIIASYGGNVTFSNVNFDNIRCSWVPQMQPPPGQAQQDGKYAMIYFFDCGDENYNCGSFEYTNGTVSRLNNGYEYGSAQFSGFLSADKIRTVKLKNVTFVNNIVYNPYITSTTYSLIKLSLFRSIEVSNCVFEKNAANYGLIYLLPTTLTFRNDANSNSELIDLLLYHVYIHDTIFENNYGQYAGILTITYKSQLQKILLENLVINGNGVLSGPLALINNQYYSSDILTDTKFYINSTSGNYVDAVFKKREFIFKNSIIINNYSGGNGIFDITQLVNMRIYNLTVESNGSLKTQNINTILWNYYVADSDIYINSIVSNAASIDCLALWSATSCYNYEISESSFRDNVCQESSPAVVYTQVENANITGCNFEGNVGTLSSGICVVSTLAGNMWITNSIFNNNTNNHSQGAGAMVFSESSKNITVMNTIISNNTANYSSGIGLKGASLILNNVRFESNKAISGLGTLYFSVYTEADTHILDIKNSIFKENQSLNVKGGAIYIIGNLLTQELISLSITDTVFKGNSALSGSAIYIENSVILSEDSIIDSCTFTQNSAQAKGTIANLFQYGILNISNSLFTFNYAELGSAFYFATSTELNSEKSKMIMTLCNFTYNSGENVICTDDMAIYSYVETAKCIFQKNEGLAVYLVNDYWKDTESVITNSTIADGTVYLTSNSTAYCELTSFINNTSTKYAGAIRAEGNSYFYCNKCTFYQNSAKNGGVLYFDQMSYFTIENSVFSHNSCSKRGSVIYIIGSDDYCSLINSKLHDNYAQAEGLIYSLTSNIKIDNCEIYNNKADGITPGIYLTLSNATITNSQFQDHQGDYGSFVYLTSDSRLSAENTEFINGKSSSSGGSIFLLSSFTNLTGCSFLNSTASFGNALLAFSSVLDVSGCKFLNTYSSGADSVINLYGGNAYIENSFFENFTYSAINGLKVVSLEVIGTSFKNSQGNIGGAISCSSTDYVYINSCNFNNNTSIYGGALYFTFTDNTISSQTYKIISTEFANNTSSAGGAIYLDNINADIKLCNFYQNQAIATSQTSEKSYESGIGGAMKLGCSYSGECSFSVADNNFVKNQAEYEGGAIVWREVMPIFKNNTFTSNEAEYGENIASYPVTMKIINNNWNGELKDLASGQTTTTPLIVALIDHLGSVVSTDDSSVGEIIALSKDVVLSGELKVAAVSGIFNFSSFAISAKPGSNFSIEVQTNGIDALKSAKAGDGLTYNSSIFLDVTLRNCVLGEATVGNNCVVCPKDFYSLNPDNDQCLSCPDQAICYGNYTMVPKPGYWRFNMLSKRFWSCPNSEACIGSDSQNISYTGNCLKGYTGNLCQSCASGYSRQSKNQCSKCQSLTVIIIKTSGISFGFLVLCWFIIRTSRISAYKPRSLSSIYIKILINYAQLISLTTTFSLSWPNYVKKLFSIQSNANFISDQIFSFDCLLYYNKLLQGESKIYYQKLLIMAILPISIPLISVIYWLSISLAQKSFAFFRDNIITTSIIASFLVHPGLIKYYFSSFDCTELDDNKYWLVNELNLRCWDSQHIFYITAISLPAILVWGIGIPTAFLFLLIKNRSQLGNINMRIKYGFLFNGYRQESYYWEFVIIYRKIGIICCSVFLATVSVNIQALTVIFLLLACLYFHCKIKPYNGDDLNRLEAISISASAVTIYCGMYYLTGSLDQITELLFFIIIISANLYFVLYWGYKAGNAYIHIIIAKISFLKKRYRVKDYSRVNDLSLREEKGKKTIEGNDPENSPNTIDFREIAMMDLFLGKLRGGYTSRDVINQEKFDIEEEQKDDDKISMDQIIILSDKIVSKSAPCEWTEFAQDL